MCNANIFSLQEFSAIMKIKFLLKLKYVSLIVILISSCSSNTLITPPDNIFADKSHEGINIIKLDNKNVQEINIKYQDNFKISPEFLVKKDNTKKIQPGDIIEILIWEAFPPLLFSSPVNDNSNTSNEKRSSNLIPSQTVNTEGYIDVPFAGMVYVANKDPYEVAKILESKLDPLSNNPQVIVRYVFDNSSMVSLVGDVNNSIRVPINYGGLKLLDLIAQNGGISSDADLISVSVSRNESSFKIPLSEVIRKPEKNIYLQYGDIVLLQSETSSFMSLGAVSANKKVKFKQSGISLVEALSRIGGWQDQRANIKKVMIYRNDASSKNVGSIYFLDMTNINSFSVASSFMIKNGDIIYASNTLRYETQKFLSLIGSVVNPFVGIQNVQNTVND